MSCRLESELRNNLFEWINNNSNNNSAIVLKCSQVKGEIELDYQENNVTAEDIADNLPDTIPRYIFFKTVLEIDSVQSVPTIVFIYFNPMDTPANLKRLYSSSKSQFNTLPKFSSFKEIEVNDTSDLTSTWVHAKALGLTGKMTNSIYK